MRGFVVAALAAFFTGSSFVYADVQSGPLVGPVPSAVKVFVTTGDAAGKELDLVADRAAKPTLVAFVPAEKWGRPTGRFFRELDAGLKEIPQSQLVVVWLSADHTASREYLPKAQMSLKFESTVLTDFTGDAGGPPEWGINGQADLTVVALRDGKVLKSWGFVSVNETLAKDVLSTLKDGPK